MKEKVKMKKILKAKTSHPDKEIFRISELTTIDNSQPLREILEGADLIDPIEVIIHLKSQKLRYGSMGIPYIEKRYSVKKGSQRVAAAKELGYTHIECTIIPTFIEARNLQKTHRHTHPQYYPTKYWV